MYCCNVTSFFCQVQANYFYTLLLCKISLGSNNCYFWKLIFFTFVKGNIDILNIFCGELHRYVMCFFDTKQTQILKF